MEGVRFLRYLDVVFWLCLYQCCYFNMGVLFFSHKGTTTQRFIGVKLFELRKNFVA